MLSVVIANMLRADRGNHITLKIESELARTYSFISSSSHEVRMGNEGAVLQTEGPRRGVDRTMRAAEP